MPLVIRGIVHQDVADPITKLSIYFKAVCSKVLQPAQLLQLESDIAVTLCKLEQIFSPSFFDVMIHLVVHLAHEVRLIGLIQYRWMYLIEKFLKKLKDYVGNKVCPKGSIVQEYLLEETVSFCSMYMEDISTRFNPIQKNYEGVPTVSDEASNSVFNQPG